MEFLLIIMMLGYASLALGDLFLIAWYKILEEEREQHYNLRQKEN